MGPHVECSLLSVKREPEESKHLDDELWGWIDEENNIWFHYHFCILLYIILVGLGPSASNGRAVSVCIYISIIINIISLSICNAFIILKKYFIEAMILFNRVIQNRFWNRQIHYKLLNKT